MAIKLTKALNDGTTEFMDEPFAPEVLTLSKYANLSFMGCKFGIGMAWQGGTMSGVSFMGCAFSKNMWSEMNFENCTFVDCTFLGNTFAKAHFATSNFHGCKFENVRMQDVSMSDCQLNKLEFSGESAWSGHLSDTQVFDSKWPNLKLDFQSLTDSRFSGMDCTDKTFPWPKASKMVWDDCKMGKVSWAKQVLANCTFNNCEFETLDISTANLDNIAFNGSQFAEISAEGFKGEYLQMGNTTIEKGNFKNLNIGSASIFMQANLKTCDFSNSKLGIAVFEKATLENVNFAKAEFTGCNLSDAHLKQVSFKDATVNNLNASDAVMDEVEGLG